MPGHDIIVIGASAGGMSAIKAIAKALPASFQGSVFVVWHLAPAARNVLYLDLNRVGALRASNAVDGEPIERGRIYIAPADHHLVLEPDRLRVTHGPKENRFRPAVDPLFRSASYAFDGRVVGIVLSGALDDGTAGLWAVKDRGGIAVVQDPFDAEFPSMPENALKYVQVDYRLPVQEIAPLLARLAEQPVDKMQKSPPTRDMRFETKVALEEVMGEDAVMNFGNLTPYTCPECHGTLVQMQTGGILRFRCHTGHAYSMNSLLEDLTNSTENTLWSAVRAFDETILFMEHMSKHLEEQGDCEAAAAYKQQIESARNRSRLVRMAVSQMEKPPVEGPRPSSSASGGNGEKAHAKGK